MFPSCLSFRFSVLAAHFQPSCQASITLKVVLGFCAHRGKEFEKWIQTEGGRKVILMIGFSTDGYVIQRGCRLTSPSLRLLISGMRKPALRTHCRTEPIRHVECPASSLHTSVPSLPPPAAVIEQRMRTLHLWTTMPHRRQSRKASNNSSNVGVRSLSRGDKLDVREENLG